MSMAEKTSPSNNSPLLARWQWLQRLEARGFRPLVALCALVCAVCLLYLYQGSTVATTTYTIGQLDATRTHLLRQHEQLQMEAARLESLDRVRREATERLGMVEPAEVRYLQVANLPAEEPVVHAFAPGVLVGPVAGVGNSGGEPSLLASIWQAIVGQFSAWGGQGIEPQAQSR